MGSSYRSPLAYIWNWINKSHAKLMKYTVWPIASSCGKEDTTYIKVYELCVLPQVRQNNWQQAATWMRRLKRLNTFYTSLGAVTVFAPTFYDDRTTWCWLCNVVVRRMPRSLRITFTSWVSAFDFRRINFIQPTLPVSVPHFLLNNYIVTCDMQSVAALKDVTDDYRLSCGSMRFFSDTYGTEKPSTNQMCQK